MGLLDHMVALFLVFKRPFTLFSIVLAPIYVISTKSARVHNLLTSSSTLVIACLFDNSLSEKCEVTAHLVLICVSPMMSDVVLNSLSPWSAVCRFLFYFAWKMPSSPPVYDSVRVMAPAAVPPTTYTHCSMAD